MNMNADVLCLVLSFLALPFSCKVTAQCTLTFQELKNSSTFTAEENESIKLPFKLSDDKECNFTDNYNIRVTKVGSPDAGKNCIIRVKSGNCYPSDGCTCTEKGTFTLERTVTREDDGNWRWLITEKNTSAPITNATIYLSVKYPARVTTLTLQNPRQSAAQDDQVLVANPGDRVQVKCSVEDGNPPVTARLLDRHRTELQTQKGDGKTVDLKYDFSSVSCDHAGIIACEAKGSQNKTTTLLVRCPLTFESEDNATYITDGDCAVLNFSIRTHSRNVTCNFTKPNSTEATRDCSSLTVTGCPPDLTVSVQLDNVTEQDQGTWRLTLTNDFGPGYVDFQLIVLGTTTSISPSITSQNGDKNNAPPGGTTPPELTLKNLQYVFVSVGALAAAVAIAVSVVVCFVRRKNLGAKMRRYLATQRAGIEAPRNEDEEEIAAHNANGGSEERLMMLNVLPSTQPVRHGARQNRYVATPGDSRHEDGDTPDRASCKPSTSSAGPEKNEDYVDIKDIKERKRQAKKEPEASGLDGRQARSIAATGASNRVDENADGLLYVQLDFSGRTTRNVMFRTLPRTDYAEVSFKASAHPPP